MSKVKESYLSENKPFIFLVAAGEIDVEWDETGTRCREKFSGGESFFVPASLRGLDVISNAGVDLFVAGVP